MDDLYIAYFAGGGAKSEGGCPGIKRGVWGFVFFFEMIVKISFVD